MSGTALEQVMASVEASNLRRREAVEAGYKRLCSGAGLPQVGPEESLAAGRFAVCLNIVTGRQPEEIERCGRLADAIVMAHPSLTDTDESARSEEHTSELQSLMRISYAVFCLKKKQKQGTKMTRTNRLDK